MSVPRIIVLASRTAHAGCDSDEATESVADVLRQRGVLVEVGYLDGAEPGLHAVLDAIATRYAAAEAEVVSVAAEVVVVPSFNPITKSNRQWLRRVLSDWRRRNDNGIALSIAAPASDAVGFADAVVGQAEAAEPVTGRAAPLLSPAWQQVPPFSSHVLVCMGPRCLALGGAQAHRGIVAARDALGVSDEELLVNQTGCMFPCSLGPVVAAYPQDQWFGSVDATSAARIVESLVTGHDDAALDPLRIERGVTYPMVQRGESGRAAESAEIVDVAGN